MYDIPILSLFCVLCYVLMGSYRGGKVNVYVRNDVIWVSLNQLLVVGVGVKVIVCSKYWSVFIITTI